MASLPEVAINCGNCGGVHSTAAEVRACYAEHPRAGSSTEEDRGDPGPGAPFLEPATPSPPAATTASSGPISAGPDRLARSLVVDADAAVPEPWSQAPRIVVDDDVLTDPAATVSRLAELYRDRRRFVVEVRADPRAMPGEVCHLEPWRLEPGFEFALDRLNHLVWSNSVDRTSGSDRWHLLERCLELGCRRAPDPESGDIVMPDGTTAWLDGGPLDLRVVGSGGEDTTADLDLRPVSGVVHALSVEGGRPSLLGTDPPGAELAPDQLAAVAHPTAAARIIAPAGSGKTRVLTERARYLIDGVNLPTPPVHLIAFNKRAQLEMRERLIEIPELRVRTINSLALAIVRGTHPFRGPAGVTGDVKVVEEWEARRVLSGLVKVRRRANVDPLAPWLEALSAVRLGLRSPSDVEDDIGDVEGLEATLRQYREVLRRRNLVDFDEQIYRAIEILLTDPPAREAARRSCRLLLVDEFQDLTPAHMLLVRLLSSPGYGVFGVGDDDQTIYGFTGATPRWLTRFSHWIPGADSHALEVNYRCPKPVVTAAANLLSYNSERVEKVIRPRPDAPADPDSLRTLTVEHPVAGTLAAVRELLDRGTRPRDIVILTRVNSLLVPIGVGLAEAGVPSTAAAGPEFLQRSGVRAALAWIRLARGGRHFSPEDIEMAARRPSRAISPRVVGWMGENHSIRALHGLADRLSGRDSEKVRSFVADLELLTHRFHRGHTAHQLLLALRNEVGMDASVDALDRSRTRQDRSSHGDDLIALTETARLQPRDTDFEPWLAEHLDRPPDPAGVHLATVHRVKGREWDHVIVHGASLGQFPHRLATDGQEERRIFHVAITRARRSLQIVGSEEEPSPYLEQIRSPRPPGSAPPPEPAARAVNRAAAPVPDRSAAEETTAAIGTPLGEALREWRRNRARRDGIPAFRVFSDRTLAEIVRRRPTDLLSLGRCHGIGPAKLEQFGDEVLAVVTATVDTEGGG